MILKLAGSNAKINDSLWGATEKGGKNTVITQN